VGTFLFWGLCPQTPYWLTRVIRLLTSQAELRSVRQAHSLQLVRFCWDFVPKLARHSPKGDGGTPHWLTRSTCLH